MLRIMAILAAIGTWMVTQNPFYTAGVLIIGWVFATIIGRILNWLFYLVLIAAGGLYLYAHQTGQSISAILWHWFW